MSIIQHIKIEKKEDVKRLIGVPLIKRYLDESGKFDLGKITENSNKNYILEKRLTMLILCDGKYAFSQIHHSGDVEQWLTNEEMMEEINTDIHCMYCLPTTDEHLVIQKWIKNNLTGE